MYWMLCMLCKFINSHALTCIDALCVMSCCDINAMRLVDCYRNVDVTLPIDVEMNGLLGCMLSC